MIQCLIQVKMLFKIRQLGFRLKRGKVNGVAIAKRSRAHINRRRCRRAPDLGRNEMKHRGQVAGRWEGEPSCQRERVKSSTRSEASKARQNRATEAGGRAATEPEAMPWSQRCSGWSEVRATVAKALRRGMAGGGVGGVSGPAPAQRSSGARHPSGGAAMQKPLALLRGYAAIWNPGQGIPGHGAGRRCPEPTYTFYRQDRITTNP